MFEKHPNVDKRPLRWLLLLYSCSLYLGCGGSSKDPGAQLLAATAGAEPRCSEQSGDQEACLRAQQAQQTSQDWQGFCIGNGCIHPQWWISNNEMNLKAHSAGLQGILLKKPVQGHFIKEVNLNLGDPKRLPRGLILFPSEKNPDGSSSPQLNSYLALLFDENAKGQWRIRARDRQPVARGTGFQEQVLDHTGRLSPWEKEHRYEAILDGSFSPNGSIRNDFRVPFTESSGKLRLFHHSHSLLDGKDQPFFYLSYSVRKNILPPIAAAEGLMSLAPIPSWLPKQQFYYVGLVLDALEAGDRVRFKDIQTQKIPIAEAATESSDFRLVKQAYHWSGFGGEALQVLFGPQFPASKRYRLVFWSEMNNVPAWHINDQLLVTNSFVELWPENRKQSPGCYEAMSDRFLWNNDVKVLADSPARKVIHWRSYLMNPAYQTIAQTLGKGPSRSLDLMPRSDEIWTVYPDGSAFRQVFYSPDQQGYGADTFEIAELSVIAGTRSSPEDHAQNGASLELWNPMGTDAFRFRPSHGQDMDGNKYEKGRAPFDSWDQLAAVLRLKDGKDNAPFIYSAFAQHWAPPYVSHKHALQYDISWHGYEWQFSHWPVNREPYEFHDQTRLTWDAQVAHSALISVQASKGGRSPERKEFVSLVGMHPNAHAISSRIQDWSYPPQIANLQGCQAPQHNARQGHLELGWQGSQCSFELKSRFQDRDFVPLVLKLRGFPAKQQLRLNVNGKDLRPDQYAMGFENEGGQSQAIIFINAQQGGISSVRLNLGSVQISKL